MRRICSEDELLEVADKLPEEVGERLLQLADGEFVTPPAPIAEGESPLNHPDVRRRFFVAENEDELLTALEAPMHRWIAFLHPSQRTLVERTFNGPSKVTGSAGTGKTVVAMHRARRLARQGHRVLMTSYVRTLCENVSDALDTLCQPPTRANITVASVHSEALRLLRAHEPSAQPIDTARELVEFHARKHAAGQDPAVPRACTPAMLWAEWEAVIEAQGITTWEAYKTARRSGRGTRLSVAERQSVWRVFANVLEELARFTSYTWPMMCQRAAELLRDGTLRSPYQAVVVDEVQDLQAPQLRFVAALCAEHPEHLMLVGDAGQRLYPGGFALSKLGIDVRGRSSVLRLNYRTTEQIRQAADRVLGSEVDDLDAGTEARAGTRSLLSGPVPTFRGYPSMGKELEGAAEQVHAWIKGGLDPTAIAVFARSNRALEAVEQAFDERDLATYRLVSGAQAPAGCVRLGTMHRAKGLEFKAVLVVGVSKNYVPNPHMLKQQVDPADRQDAYDRERQLLYVAMTRARDELVVTWTKAPSEFLSDSVAD